MDVLGIRDPVFTRMAWSTTARRLRAQASQRRSTEMGFSGIISVVHRPENSGRATLFRYGRSLP